jgi:hypothetical protein
MRSDSSVRKAATTARNIGAKSRYSSKRTNKPLFAFISIRRDAEVDV